MAIARRLSQIIKEVTKVLSKVNKQEVSDLIDILARSKKIVVVGAGRMGLSSKAFAMRLKHLGLDSYFLGDSNVPNIGKNDLLLVASGSGETKTIVEISKIAKFNQSKVALITVNPGSTIGKLADVVVKLSSPTKNSNSNIKSMQPMTTLTEQSLFILLDAIVLELMDRMDETGDSMWARHSNLE